MSCSKLVGTGITPKDPDTAHPPNALSFAKLECPLDDPIRRGGAKRRTNRSTNTDADDVDVDAADVLPLAVP